MSSRARRTAWVLGLALVLSTALVLTLVAVLTWGPPLARDRIARELSELLGRTITIESIESRPWQGRFGLTGLRVASPAPPSVAGQTPTAAAAAENQSPPLRLASIQVHLDLLQLASRHIRLLKVELLEPQAVLRRSEQGQIDLQDLIDRIAALSASPPSSPPSRWTWSVDHLTLQGAAVQVQDDRAQARFDLQALNLEAHDLSAQGDQGRITLSSRLQGAPLKADLRIAALAEQPRGQAKVELGLIELQRLTPWVPLPPSMQLESGRLSAELNIEFDLQATLIERLSVAGTLALEDLRMMDGAQAPGLHLPKAKLTLDRSTPVGGLIRVKSLEIDAPSLSSGRHRDGSLIWPLLPKEASASASASVEASVATTLTPTDQTSPAALPVRGLKIDQIRISQGMIRWNDEALNTPLRLAVDHIELAAQGLHIADLSRPDLLEAQWTLSARINEQATMQSEARYTAGELDAQLTARQVPLQAWLPALLPSTAPEVRLAPLDLQGRVRMAGAGASVVLEDLRLQTAQWRIGQARDVLAQAQASRVTQLDARWQNGRLDIDTLKLELSQLQVAQGQRMPQLALQARASGLTAAMDRPIPVQANLSLGEAGTLALKGDLQPTPLRLDAQATLQGLDLTLLQPYADPYMNLVIQNGSAWGSGRLKLTQAAPPSDTLQIGWQGDISVNGLRSVDKISNEPFVNLGALALPRVQLQMTRPAAPDDHIVTSDIALVDFYARIILGADGKLNLGRALTDPTSPETTSVSLTQVQPASAAAPSTPSAAAASLAGLQATPAPAPAPAPAATRSEAQPLQNSRPGAASPVSPRIRLGTIRVAGGDVDFTDRFIKPNYSARLAGLHGAITPARGDLQGPAEVEISGHVDGDTPLEITGRIDLLAAEPFLDLRAVARGFDLPKLSPYSGKWAGYAIEKGKLTATLRYKLTGENLQAENRLVINQLTFGEKVESPDAFKIPVQFAISLLKDSNGVIDLDLPIAGTLSDPQFSVGGLIWRAIGNLLLKVVTAPFSALASLAQDGLPENELSHLVFEPGSGELDEQDHKRLGALARALKSRPELNLDLTGYADPESDRQALSERRLKDLIERNRLPLTAAREKELRAQAEASNDELRDLAQQRAQNARRVLRDEHELSNERLFLISPRLASPEDSLPPRRVGFDLKRPES